MKPLIILLSFAVASFGAEVRIDARTVSSSRSAAEKWKTAWGSYDRDIYRARSIVAAIRSDVSAPVVVEALWIGREPHRGARQRVVHAEAVRINLKANLPSQLTFDALFVENDAKYAALGIRDRSGHKYIGWVVRVVDSKGRVLAARGARPPLVDFTKKYVVKP